jgi:polyribonucleotide nucleotidyltransferase
VPPAVPRGLSLRHAGHRPGLSQDKTHPADTLALTGASAALTISDIPFSGPIAGVRVGRVDGKFLANPTFEQMAKSDVDIVVAASRDAIVMVEGGADEIPRRSSSRR